MRALEIIKELANSIEFTKIQFWSAKISYRSSTLERTLLNRL